ncbi:MAG TPA: 50S ribosomal protein L23 [Vitreimonas sp.]|nr:50S ribosomal protein L23 [Vitreimonas sp.]
MNAFIIKQPVITEKSMLLANTENTYTFEVARNANKQQIQDAVEKLYGVAVESVNTVVGHNSPVRTGRKRLKSVQTKVKKAMVKLKAGQTIALFDLSGN